METLERDGTRESRTEEPRRETGRGNRLEWRDTANRARSEREEHGERVRVDELVWVGG